MLMDARNSVSAINHLYGFRYRNNIFIHYRLGCCVVEEQRLQIYIEYSQWSIIVLKPKS